MDPTVNPTTDEATTPDPAAKFNDLLAQLDAVKASVTATMDSLGITSETAALPEEMATPEVVPEETEVTTEQPPAMLDMMMKKKKI